MFIGRESNSASCLALVFISAVTQRKCPCPEPLKILSRSTLSGVWTDSHFLWSLSDVNFCEVCCFFLDCGPFWAPLWCCCVKALLLMQLVPFFVLMLIRSLLCHSFGGKRFVKRPKARCSTKPSVTQTELHLSPANILSN